MADLSHLLASTPMLEWVEATVLRVNGDYLTLSYHGGEVDNVAYLSTYTPVLDDTVQVLSMSNRGMLVLGAAKKTGAGIGPLPTPTSAEVPADSIATWHVTADGTAWETGVFASTGPNDYGVWLYDLGAITVVGMDMLTLFEIQVDMSGGGPAEFFLHNQVGAGGVLEILTSNRYVTDPVPHSTLVWVPLPVGWGEELLAGRARGIGVGGGMFSATWVAGAGRLRFTGV